jgi:hypothetical protein
MDAEKETTKPKMHRIVRPNPAFDHGLHAQDHGEPRRI